MSNPNVKHEDPRDSLILSLEKRLLETTFELHKAHKIIFNALLMMTVQQRAQWAKVNQRSELTGLDSVRSQEREALLKSLETEAL